MVKWWVSLGRDFQLVLGLLAVVSVVLGAVLTLAIYTHNLPLEVIVNIPVAIGTLALAYFTWESVRSTKAVIAGEDRRHQVSYAPVLFLDRPTQYGKTNETIGIVLANKGLGFSPSGTYDIKGRFLSDVFKDGNRLDPLDFHAIGTYGLVATGAPNTVELNTLPQDYNAAELSTVILRYRDMFDNPYSTYYSNWHKDNNDFLWMPPDNLRPPLPDTT